MKNYSTWVCVKENFFLLRSRSSRRSSTRSRSGTRDRGTGTAAAAPATGGGEGDKEGVNLGLSGALTEETNTLNGTVIKYSEPPEARKPKRKWRLYVFKGKNIYQLDCMID